MLATQLLPPSSRDLEIHRQNLIEHLSTRRLAELHKISQTRVRQIVYRVCQWLAAMLPVPTEADLEQEKRLAVHIAAAALQHQIEQLQTLFDATYDPKYLRQQTRAILALARLGTSPGALDSLALDCGAGVSPASAACGAGADRLASLHHTLANIRREQAALELQIAPSILGAAIATPPAAPAAIAAA